MAEIEKDFIQPLAGGQVPIQLARVRLHHTPARDAGAAAATAAAAGSGRVGTDDGAVGARSSGPASTTGVPSCTGQASSSTAPSPKQSKPSAPTQSQFKGVFWKNNSSWGYEVRLSDSGKRTSKAGFKDEEACARYARYQCGLDWCGLAQCVVCGTVLSRQLR